MVDFIMWLLFPIKFLIQKILRIKKSEQAIIDQFRPILLEKRKADVEKWYGVHHFYEEGFLKDLEQTIEKSQVYRNIKWYKRLFLDLDRTIDKIKAN